MSRQSPANDVYIYDSTKGQVSQKVLKTNGELLMYGKHCSWGIWINPTRYTAFVHEFKGWFVAVMTATGMDTTVTGNFSEVGNVKGTKSESFRPNSCVILQSKSNQKVISLDGKFMVNGKLFGDGEWVSPTRFVVPAWGGFWIGDIVNQGMNTMVVRNKADIERANPTHFELGARSLEYDVVPETPADN